MSAREEWIEAGRVTVERFANRCEFDDRWCTFHQSQILDTCGQCREFVDLLDLAEQTIAAVEPLIREAIARDLEREARVARRGIDGHHPSVKRWTDSAVLKFAARIARGDA